MIAEPAPTIERKSYPEGELQKVSAFFALEPATMPEILDTCVAYELVTTTNGLKRAAAHR